jgi:hypothetical protein
LYYFIKRLASFTLAALLFAALAFTPCAACAAWAVWGGETYTVNWDNTMRAAKTR